MTVQQKKRDARRSTVTADEVAEYLRAHPDFFEQRVELLQDLVVPHPSGGAVSLIERQVAVLRDQNHKLRKQMQDLIGIARDNDRLFARLHHLTGALIEADSLDAVTAALYDRLRESFSADLVAVRLIVPEGREHLRDRPEFVTPDVPGVETFAGMLTRGKPVCGRFNTQQLQFLFGGGASEVKSAAVVPLGSRHQKLGFLAIASLDANRFSANMSTVFLTYLGETVTQVLRRYLG